MSFKIKDIEFENNVVLAPMAGITDLPFRTLCKEFGAGYMYTELISAKGLMYENENTHKLLEINKKEHPVAVQIFGSDKNVLSTVAKKLDSEDFDILDINMGCPAPKIIRNGEGSALMKNPKLIGEIVKNVVMATKKPVTVKIRKGFDLDSVNAVEVAQIAEYNGASCVAVHGRTRSQFYSGRSDIEIIKAVKSAVNIPVIGNGDIVTPQDAKHMLDYTNCDAVMIGRASEGNPWIFKEVIHYLKTGELLEKPTLEEKVMLSLRHAKMLIEYKGLYTGIREMRKHIGWYTKGMPKSAELRSKINKTESYEEMEKLMLTLIS